MKARVLIVEDEPVMADALADNLKSEGYEVDIASDGATAKERWGILNPDLVILDVMLPKISGIDVCRQMRKSGFSTPVLFLSAKGESEERAEGLRAGGDDYVAKPFHLPEFLLRVHNLLRRHDKNRLLRTYHFGGHIVDFSTYTATLSDNRVEQLGERELDILRLLSSRVGQVVSRDEMLDKIWGQEVFPSSRTIDNFMVRLRRLFEPDPANPIYFHTIWGVGYRFTPEGTHNDE